jgi:hypothetical protein
MLDIRINSVASSGSVDKRAMWVFVQRPEPDPAYRETAQVILLGRIWVLERRSSWERLFL